MDFLTLLMLIKHMGSLLPHSESITGCDNRQVNMHECRESKGTEHDLDIPST
jgi:hypothetical protein